MLVINFGQVNAKVIILFYFCKRTYIKVTRLGPIAAVCLSVLFSSLSFSVRAQKLTSLPKASEVSTGTLPNGISYYLVTNRDAKGYADFALVQKKALSEEVSRAALAELPHFQGGKPYQYLAKLGVGYETNGHLHSEGHSMTFHFKNVPVDIQSARDTTLLLLFDIAETCPYEQAVIVSGDIDKASVQERMNVFSMMVTAREKVPETEDTLRSIPDSVLFKSVRVPQRSGAVLKVSYSAPRTPRNVMNTVQPLVAGMFANELGIIVTKRMERLFMQEGIPASDVGWEYRSSADGPLEELYRFSVTVPQEKLMAATAMLSSVLAGLKESGASSQEFEDARDRTVTELAFKRMSNSDWVDKCKSSYLYGSDLSSSSAVKEFFSSRSIDLSTELELFNSFISALIDGHHGLGLEYASSGAEVRREDAVQAFDAGWNRSEEYVPPFSRKDSLGLYSNKSVKSKLKRIVPEPVTGGELWTFANGLKVIYKKSAMSEGRFSYGFLINGGYADVKELSRGEGGYIADMLKVCDVAGLSGKAFYDMLEANGIGFSPSVSLTDLRITGSAPSSGFQLLMKSLLSIANERKVNRGAYEYFRSCERLRLSSESRLQSGINAVVDSIMCPDYRFSDYKSASGLSDDLPERAEEYFSKQFSKCSDGVLVLIGDLDPYMLKKVLPKYLGNFATGGLASPRPQIKYTLRSGWSTYTVEAGESVSEASGSRVNVAESVLLPFSLEKFVTSRMAVMEFEKKLRAALSEAGTHCEVSSDYELFPAERLTLRISCYPADESGLPAGVSPKNPLRVLGMIRSAMSELSSGQQADASSDIVSPALSKASVNSSKAALLAVYESELSHDPSLVDAALMRYSVGKDFVTGYKEKINAVSADSIREILSALEEGSKVEYVIY